MNEEIKIHDRINTITQQLKIMSSENPNYPKLWDERVDLKHKLFELQQSNTPNN